jgi:cellobiose transport system substrate-binding protein
MDDAETPPPPDDGRPAQSRPRRLLEWARRHRRSRRAVVLFFAAIAVLADTFSLIPLIPDLHSPPRPVTLTVGTYGDSFPSSLYQAYQRDHPWVTITERRTPYALSEEQLERNIASGRDAGDLEVVELPYMPRFTRQPEAFVDFRTADVDTSAWAAGALQPGRSLDGELIGLPIDIGGLALCFRKDLFQQAGLPTDSAAVEQMFDSWPAYVRAGRRFSSHAPDGVAWFDSGIHFLNGILGSHAGRADSDLSTYDAAGDPEVKQAWDLAAGAIEAGLSAHVTSNRWTQALRSGQFATITCPAWMQGRIKREAPGDFGQWGVVPVPGESGNWSGSFLTVPAKGEHRDEAIALARWLVHPKQQLATFDELGNFPSSSTAWQADPIRNHRDPYFDDAAIGQIITTALRGMSPAPIRQQSGLIATAVQPALRTVERGTSPAVAWLEARKQLAIQTR